LFGTRYPDIWLFIETLKEKSSVFTGFYFDDSGESGDCGHFFPPFPHFPHFPQRADFYKNQRLSFPMFEGISLPLKCGAM